MTENNAINKIIKEVCSGCYGSDEEPQKCSTCGFKVAKDALKEIQQYRAIGTIEEFKDLKEKNTPMELAEHNFQDEVHHYLCPSCRSIVSCTQNYCEECGQALET